VLDRMPQHTRDRLPHVQPNFLLPLLRKGIDPFNDPFPVTLRGEGTIRGTGGIALSGPDCQAGVEGLYAAGDVASRQPIVGAASGGGQPNSAWCVASGTWSGRAAAGRASQRPLATTSAAGDGVPPRGVGQRTGATGSASHTDAGTEEIRRAVSRELNDLDKNMFRSGEGLRRSLALLDDLWTQVRAPGGVGVGVGPVDAGRDAVRARETAALVAAGRWVLHSAIVRQESRGMHQRSDTPARDPEFTATVRAWGLDTVLTAVEPKTERHAKELCPANRAAS
jgi:succinate dehydrogenase/fumarate reductase flavoprotein subunit